MSAEPLFVPDDFGDGEDERLPDGIPGETPPRYRGPGQDLVDPNDPNSDFVPGDWWNQRSQGRGTPARPLIAHRCERIKSDGMRCRRWAMHGLRYCVSHSGARNLPNVRELHEQTVHNARLALMETVPAALNRIGLIIDDETGDVPASVQLKAATEVLDRVGVRGGSELNVTVEETTDPATALSTRLDQLRSRAEEMAAAEAAREGDVIDGEIVEDDDGEQLDLFAEEEAP